MTDQPISAEVAAICPGSYERKAPIGGPFPASVICPYCCQWVLLEHGKIEVHHA